MTLQILSRSLILSLLTTGVIPFGKMTSADDDPFAAVIRPTDPLSPQEERQSLQLPDGFRATLFASEPEIQKPINMAFDAQGRLWVSGSNDYPYPNLKSPGDSIRILEDTDGDGSADRVTTFVDDVTLPVGLLPYRDGVIAFSIPNITFFRDTDGDGRCDARNVLLGPFDYSRDTHGLNNSFRRGLDGWIYACHGFNNRSRVAGSDSHRIEMNSGNTYRFRPDGSRIEHWTWGQINPFGMTFDRRGDLFSADCHTKPMTLLMWQGQYPGFGRQHDGLGFVPGMMTHLHGSTAIAGLAQNTGSEFPKEYKNSFFLGNVMSSRVHRDTLQETGSTLDAIAQHDFIVSRDPWFRPVDLRFGPDGALYIADFYNRIIGHYEVPLDHPRRDRHRGRIWRIDYVGDGDDRIFPSRHFDLTRLAVSELIAASAEAPVSRMIQILDELTDRHGPAATPELRALLDADLTPEQQIVVLWALQRLGELSTDELCNVTNSDDDLPRIHAQRLLAARGELSDELDTAMVAGLRDANPFVKRAAAAALARHPRKSHARPILDAMINLPAGDVHLRHQLKIALRNQLEMGGTLPELLKSADESDKALLAEICLGLDGTDATAFLLEMLQDPDFEPDQPQQVIQRLARWATPAQWNELIPVIERRFPDLNTRLNLAVQALEAAQQNTDSDLEILNDWSRGLVQKTFQVTGNLHGWKIVTGDPLWDFETRRSSDGVGQRHFLSSLPGGERGTGTLRSATFPLPKSLSFFVCGHLGFPNQPPQNVNFVRLCLADGGEELARALAPRNDIAQPVSWNFTERLGQSVYLEIVDGLDERAYAWIAVGRLDPTVVSLPETGIITAQKMLQQALELCAELKLESFESDIRNTIGNRSLPSELRRTAGKTLGELTGSPEVQGLSVLIAKSGLRLEQQERIEQLVTAEAVDDVQVQALLKELPSRLQIDVAAGLIGTRAGAERLLEFLESGVISPRALANPLLKAGLKASGAHNASDRVAALERQLPPSSGQREALLQSIQKKFGQAEPTPTDGASVFEKRCATCHQIGGVGQVIGPQLDGIGSRGLERLIEDVLDPNRNVDVAFRTHVYALDDGTVHSGVVRRETDSTVIIANQEGKEVSLSKARIELQRVSAVSIMPDNWAEIIPESEFYDLLAYLMRHREKVQNATMHESTPARASP